MPDTDRELLALYVQNADNAAFGELTRRHINMVHAAATRQTRDPHLADDVTQAVFMVLARRARDIRNRGTLAGWLILTTRNAALAALRAKSRREFHERKAAAMTDPIQVTDDPVTALDMNALLDAGMAKLGELDRTVVSLRYLQGKTIHDVASATGISDDAAQKRATRALEKLRDYFASRSVVVEASALPTAMLLHASHLAPAPLAATVAGHASLSANASASLIAKSVLKSMMVSQLKVTACAVVASIALIGTIAIPVHRYYHSSDVPQAVVSSVASVPIAPPIIFDISPTTRPASMAIDIPNVLFLNATTPGYIVGIDMNTHRVDAAAGYIKSTQSNSVRGTRKVSRPAIVFAGHRVRLTAWLKSHNVTDWGALHMMVYSKTGQILADDDMRARGITGTTDWEQFEIVEDIPVDAVSIYITSYLQGTGELWSDGFHLETVSTDVPTTDDQNWHLYSPQPKYYTAKLDRYSPRNGKPTMCITARNVPRGSWVNYDRNDRNPAQYLGKRLHISAWIKCEDLTSTGGLMIQALGKGDYTLASEGQRGRRPVKGTADWTLYNAFIDVPLNTQTISSGFTMNGNGKVWIDDLQYEVIEMK